MGLRSWVIGAAAATAIGTAMVTSQLHHVEIVVQSPTGARDVKLWTFRSTVRKILLQAGISINRHDKIAPGLNQPLRQKTVTVRQAIPVWVKTAHRHLRVWTTQYRVQGILSALSIKLGPMDRVKPQIGQKVLPNGTIHVLRRWLITKDIRKPLFFSIQYQPDPNLYKGHNQISQTGQNGVGETVVQYLMQNGKTIRQKVLKRKIVAYPRDEIIQFGTSQLVARGGQVLQFSRVLTMVSTGYWPSATWSGGYTAMGLQAHYGIAAVDPRVIPLGTRLYIPGYGFALAADTGSAIVGDRIDLCFNSGVQAQDWGVRNLKVFVLQ